VNKFLMMLLTVGLAACDSSLNAGNSCNAQTCEGCCTQAGVCRAGNLTFACGTQGAACTDCAAMDGACTTAGFCSVAAAGGGAGGAGGNTGGGTGGAGGGSVSVSGDGGWNPLDWRTGPFQTAGWDAGFPLDLSGAEALALSTIDGWYRRRLYKISASGTVGRASTATNVFGFLPVSGGVFIDADVGKFVVDSSTGRSRELPDDVVGQNAHGDLVMQDGSALRKASGVIEPIAPGAISRVDSLEGNVAVVTFTTGTVQAVDTVTGLRYSIRSCNGPTISALNATTVVVNDCEEMGLLDMATGVRTPTSIHRFNGPHLSVSDGSVFLSSSCPGGTGGFGFCYANPAGVVTALLPSEVSSPSRLMGDGLWFVFRELNQTSLVQRGTNQKSQILNGIDIQSASLRAATLYYSGYNSVGGPVFGKVELASARVTPVVSPEPVLSVQFLVQ